MARQIKQFIWCGDDDSRSTVIKAALVDGSFIDNMSIIQLGIQAPSGVRFILNDNIGNPAIVIDSSNIYELNVDGMTIIDSIKFQESSLSEVTKMIIDIVYEGMEGA